MRSDLALFLHSLTLSRTNINNHPLMSDRQSLKMKRKDTLGHGRKKYGPRFLMDNLGTMKIPEISR